VIAIGAQPGGQPFQRHLGYLCARTGLLAALPKFPAAAIKRGMVAIAKECNELNRLDPNLFSETTTDDRL
jgi:hypothetical protein